MAVTGLAAVLIGSSIGSGAAAGTWGKATKIAGGDTDYTFGASTYAIVVKKDLYQYATGTDGYAYYNHSDGATWDGWKGWEDQPATYAWDPAPVEYKDNNYAFYTGKDGGIYHLTWEGEQSQWTKVSGEYTFKYAPYANENGDTLYLYAVGKDDSSVYVKNYDGSTWSDWSPISEDNTAAYEPYAVEWDNHENVLWTGEDGKVYWNRYNGSEWTGVKALPGDYQFAGAPAAAEYDGKLYAFAATADGQGAYNVFAPDTGWSGWEVYDGTAELTWQPAAAVYEDQLHVAFTAGDGHAYTTTYDGKAWGDWTDLGDNYAYDPYLYEHSGEYRITYTGQNGYAYYKVYAGEKDSGY